MGSSLYLKGKCVVGSEFGSIQGQVGAVEVLGGHVSGVVGIKGLTKSNANEPSLRKAQPVLTELPFYHRACPGDFHLRLCLGSIYFQPIPHPTHPQTSCIPTVWPRAAPGTGDTVGD